MSLRKTGAVPGKSDPVIQENVLGALKAVPKETLQLVAA